MKSRNFCRKKIFIESTLKATAEREFEEETAIEVPSDIKYLKSFNTYGRAWHYVGTTRQNLASLGMRSDYKVYLTEIKEWAMPKLSELRGDYYKGVKIRGICKKGLKKIKSYGLV